MRKPKTQDETKRLDPEAIAMLNLHTHMIRFHLGELEAIAFPKKQTGQSQRPLKR